MKMKKDAILKRILAIVLAASAASGCAQSNGTATPAESAAPATPAAESQAPSETPAAEHDYKTGTPWLCSFLDGNVTKDTPMPDLKDDFYLACNKDALAGMTIPDGYRSMGTQMETAIQVDEDIKNLFTSSEKAESHDGQLALDLYSFLSDWDSRNKVGAAPLKKMTDAVEAIDSLDALTAYLAEAPIEDRLSNPYSCHSYADPDNSSVSILTVVSPDLMLNDAAEYTEITPLGQITKDAKSTFARRLLLKLGYTEEDAQRMIENCLSFETELASSMLTQTDMKSPSYIQMVNNHYTREELTKLQGSLPILDTMEKVYGFPKAETYLVMQPKNIEKLNSLYTEENLDRIKDYMIVNGIQPYASVLDRECYDWATECTNEINGTAGSLPDEIALSQMVNGFLDWPVARLYCERYLDQKDKDRIREFIEEVIAEYYGIIQEADFLSEETKTHAIEKLDTMNRQVLWPDDWTKYEYAALDFTPAAEGGTLWDAITALSRYLTKKQAEKYSQPFDKDYWEMTPTTFNCAYSPTTNSISIMGAFARGTIYNPEMSDEDLYAKIGTVIGHEISHAFDSMGAQFDKDGNVNQWWTDQDWNAFEEKNQKVIDYFAKIHPWEGQDYYPESKGGEAVADMAAVKCMLRLAAKKENFDYDKYFRSLADLWLAKGTLNMTYIYITDEHPLPYLRVNCPLQQYDEFLDFYGIKEGDGMYLAPEDRINVW